MLYTRSTDQYLEYTGEGAAAAKDSASDYESACSQTLDDDDLRMQDDVGNGQNSTRMMQSQTENDAEDVEEDKVHQAEKDKDKDKAKGLSLGELSTSFNLCGKGNFLERVFVQPLLNCGNVCTQQICGGA